MRRSWGKSGLISDVTKLTRMTQPGHSNSLARLLDAFGQICVANELRKRYHDLARCSAVAASSP